SARRVRAPAATRRTCLHVMPPHRQNPSGCSPADGVPRELALRQGNPSGARLKRLPVVPPCRQKTSLRAGNPRASLSRGGSSRGLTLGRGRAVGRGGGVALRWGGGRTSAGF